ncbi:hypothetical protein ACPV4A_09260 [Vibrio rotiferianus]
MQTGTLKWICWRLVSSYFLHVPFFPPLFDLVFGDHWHVLAFADRERVDNTKAVANE